MPIAANNRSRWLPGAIPGEPSDTSSSPSKASSQAQPASTRNRFNRGLDLEYLLAVLRKRQLVQIPSVFE